MTTTLQLQRLANSAGYQMDADGKYGQETRNGLASALNDLIKLRGAVAPVVPANDNIDRAKLFAALRKTDMFAAGLTQPQVEGIEAILDGWEKSDHTDLRWLGYMLGTAYHETASTMQPVRETLAPTDSQSTLR